MPDLLGVWPLLVGMVVQTVVLARVNEIRLQALAEGVREAKQMAGGAHRRIDSLRGWYGENGKG